MVFEKIHDIKSYWTDR